MNRNDFASGKKEEEKVEPQVSDKPADINVSNDPGGLMGALHTVGKSLIPDSFIKKLDNYIPENKPKQ
jgi:hypothetical protein